MMLFSQNDCVKELWHLSGLGTISLTSEVLFPISSSRLKWTELEEILVVFLMTEKIIYILERQSRTKIKTPCNWTR